MGAQDGDGLHADGAAVQCSLMVSSAPIPLRLTKPIHSDLTKPIHGD